MKNFLTHHPIMKLLSVVLAFSLWLLVRAEQYTEVNVNAKVILRNVPANLVVAGDYETEVRLRLAGPRTRLRTLNEREVEPVIIDLSDAKQGVNAFAIYGDEFKTLPRGVHVTRIVPQVIRIALDEAEERLVKIEPTFSGELEEGYEFVGSEVSPTYFKVRGAKSELENLSTLKTIPISLTGHTTSFEGVSPLRTYRLQWELNDKKVQVRVQTRQKQSKQGNR